MKWLLIALVKFYQKVHFGRASGKCLFRESCSSYVHRITFQRGFISGLRALSQRFRVCRSGYFIISYDTALYFYAVDGTRIPTDQIRPSILSIPLLRESVGKRPGLTELGHPICASVMEAESMK
jgi:putative component of membrane protein insertase Oxa1/YidC/SpoIIIJ protein YidD